MLKPALIAIDQGTTSSRAIAFAVDSTPITSHQKEHQQIYPQHGWVEHNCEEIWENTLNALQQVYADTIKKGYTPQAIGITNQRETIIAWDKTTGATLHNALVWQDKRSADFCNSLKEKHEQTVKKLTGLPLDPYFSASKMHWLLENIPSVKQAAANKTLAFGTIDSFLLWKLTNGEKHLTDTTNAARTLLFDIHKLEWSAELLAIFSIPEHSLPEVLPNTANFGHTANGILPEPLPISAMAGDQHAATFGQACFNEGMVKSTYGTGCFALLNTGNSPVVSSNGLLTTIAYHIGDKPVYALEGSIFVAGAGVQWLRDKLGIIKTAKETEQLAKTAPDNHDLYFVPAFAGLGAPWWDSGAKGTIVGMTLDTDKAAIVRAMLEAVCLQTNDLLSAMASDTKKTVTTIKIDGGMVSNNWLAQQLASLTNTKVSRPTTQETTALGAAWLAGLQIGVYKSTNELTHKWCEDASFNPELEQSARNIKLTGWQKAVTATQNYSR